MAGELVKVDLPSLGGGLNQSSAPSQIQDHEASKLVNWYPEENRLIRRKGCSRITTTPYGQTIHGLAPYKKSSAWEVVLGVLTSLAKLDGNVIVTVPTSSSISIPSSTEPWSMEQYQNVLYSVRNDGIQLVRYDGDGYGPSGISAPPSAPTLADGGAGTMVAGDYVGAVAFRNSQTGAISNISSLSGTLSLGSSKQIAWSGIAIPASGQADQRVLYRSVANQIGVVYRVVILNNTTATTYTDNVGPDDLEDPNNLDNGIPPSGGKMLAVWRERMFIVDGRDLFFSRAYFPESFGEFNYISIAPDDGHVMGGIGPFGDRLLVGKTNAMYYLLGTGPENFTVRTLDDKAGCHSHASIQAMAGIAIWFGGTQFYKTDGSQAVGIGDIKVRKALDDVPPQYYQLVDGVYVDTHKWYQATLPGTDGAPRWLATYDLRSGTWNLGEYHSSLAYAPTKMREFADQYYGRLIYGSFGDGHLYRLNYGNTDNGNLIKATWRSKAFDFAQKGILKRSKRVSFLLYPRTEGATKSGTLNARIYHNLNTTANNARSFDMSELEDYVRVGLSSIDEAAKLIRFEVEYEGEPQMELAEMSVEAIIYPRGGKVR